MSLLEERTIKTDLPDETVEQIIMRSFGGREYRPKMEYHLSYIVPLKTSLTPEQISDVSNYPMADETGEEEVTKEKFIGAEFKPQIYISKSLVPRFNWLADEFLYIAMFREGMYAGLSINAFTPTELQKEDLGKFLAEFRSVVTTAERT